MHGFRHQPTLRQKARVDLGLSDRELFERLEVGDSWVDAGLPAVYQYIREHPRCQVPDSWAQAFAELDVALRVELRDKECESTDICRFG